jgi:hypothetical protein
MRVKDLALSPTEQTEFEAFGEQWANYLESGFEAAGGPTAPIPPEVGLRQARFAASYAANQMTQAVQQARQAGLSWHRIGRQLDLTAEGARRRFSQKVA